MDSELTAFLNTAVRATTGPTGTGTATVCHAGRVRLSPPTVLTRELFRSRKSFPVRDYA